LKGRSRFHRQELRLSKPSSIKQVTELCLFAAVLIFQPENGGEIFLGNVGWLSADCMAVYPEVRNLNNDCCETFTPDVNCF
jgi:hypothetical protein